MNNKIYTATIKGFEKVKLSDNTSTPNITKISKNKYIVQVDGINYPATVLHKNLENKSFEFNINGRIVELDMSDELDRLVNKMEFNKGDQEAAKDLLSPMPGLILSIDVEVGQDVKKGEKLFTLEAMKMENIIKSSVDGIVKTIPITLNDAVEKGALLLSFE